MKKMCMFIMKLLGKCLWLFSYSQWIYHYLRLTLGVNVLKRIKILSIEFSSVCNLKCKYCFLDRKSRDKFLDLKFYEKLLKEVCENQKYNINVLEWPISGEFLVYPYYKEVIDLTKKYMDDYSSFNPHIILNDNMMLMDEEKIDFILSKGIIKQIICSIDGHNRDSFEVMRPPAKFDTVLKNFRLLVEKNNKLGHTAFIQVNNGRDESSQGKEFSNEFKEMFSLADSVTFWYPQYWNESFNKSQKKFHPSKGFCQFVFNSVTLNSSGYIAKCCMDLSGATQYGDLSKNSLEEIWYSKERKLFLKQMFFNKRASLNGCRNCSISYVNNDNRCNNLFRTLKRKFLSRFK